VVQHFARIGHTSQSRFEARYSRVRPSCTVPLVLSSFPLGALENVAQNIALTEPVQSVLGEGRVVGNGVIEIEPAEPSVGEMEPHLLAQLPLGADAEAVPIISIRISSSGSIEGRPMSL
jgi:hypothetical protein